MKFSLTITDATHEEIIKFLAGSPAAIGKMTALSGATMLSTRVTDAEANSGSFAPTMTMPPDHQQVMALPDDDNAPANINAPSADTAGIPWDDRIHSKNKNLNADGTWRKKRGVEGATVAAVEAELKSRSLYPAPSAMPHQQPQPQFTPPSSHVQMPSQGMPAPQPMQPPMPINGMPNGGLPPQYQPQPMQPPMPPQGMPNGQYMQPPAPAPTALDFNGFMQQLSAQMAKRDQNGQPLIHTDYLASVVQRLTAHFGRQFNSITDISGDANAINAAVAFITADGRWN